MGRLGANLSNPANRSSPIQISGTDWSLVSSTYSPVMATRTDGTLWVWERSTDGELGQTNLLYRSSPTQVPGTWKNSHDGFQSKRNYFTALKPK